MEKQKKNSHIGLKILGGGLVLGIGAYVVNEVRKEYNNTVNENNYLRDFIDNHDFYKKENLPKIGSSPKFQNQSNSENKFAFTKKKRTPTASYQRADGMTVNEYFDERSGFTIIELEQSKEENEKANEA